MTNPIMPTPEMIHQWMNEEYGYTTLVDVEGMKLAIAKHAAQWGADQELEACLEWLKVKHWVEPEFADELRAARRPKPPTLKEQALDVLHLSFDRGYLKEEAADTIRRALEALPE